MWHDSLQSPNVLEIHWNMKCELKTCDVTLFKVKGLRNGNHWTGGVIYVIYGRKLYLMDGVLDDEYLRSNKKLHHISMQDW